jgi:hypothetical protein
MIDFRSLLWLSFTTALCPALAISAIFMIAYFRTRHHLWIVGAVAAALAVLAAAPTGCAIFWVLEHVCKHFATGFGVESVALYGI